MENIIPIIKKSSVELILIIAATIISATVFILYNTNQSTPPQVLSVQNDIPNSDKSDEYISIDISGAVVKANVYKMPPNARMKDVIDSAGGFSKDADTAYVARNFNLAQVLQDQEKIYIPTKEEIEQGIFPDINQPTEQAQDSEKTQNSQEENSLLVSLNTASLEELDVLPGIGPTTAQKIIDNRPYSTVNELLEKKVTSASTYNKIKDLVKL